MGHDVSSLIWLLAAHGCERAISLAVSTHADGRDALLIVFLPLRAFFAALAGQRMPALHALEGLEHENPLRRFGAGWSGISRNTGYKEQMRAMAKTG
jgi:hypothetical protein